MKILTSCIVCFVIITTAIFAQIDEKKYKVLDRIEYIKKETIAGKFDFTSILSVPGHLPIDHKGIRFNKEDYFVFLWGEAVSDSGLESSTEASRLWEEIYGKKLTGPQRTALRIGFEKGIK